MKHESILNLRLETLARGIDSIQKTSYFTKIGNEDANVVIVSKKMIDCCIGSMETPIKERVEEVCAFLIYNDIEYSTRGNTITVEIIQLEKRIPVLERKTGIVNESEFLKTSSMEYVIDNDEVNQKIVDHIGKMLIKLASLKYISSADVRQFKFDIDHLKICLRVGTRNKSVHTTNRLIGTNYSEMMGSLDRRFQCECGFFHGRESVGEECPICKCRVILRDFRCEKED